jgi:AefR-like transcriptional repressor, C-terminal domain
VLLAQGRHRTGRSWRPAWPAWAAAGQLRVDDPAEAFRLLYGLVVRDLQIRVLLGEPPPPAAALAEQARTAVDRFLTLTAIPQEPTLPRSASKRGPSGRVDGA